MGEISIEISRHAREQMQERGASEEEVVAAIRTGTPEPARNQRTM